MSLECLRFKGTSGSLTRMPCAEFRSVAWFRGSCALFRNICMQKRPAGGTGACARLSITVLSR